jgi:regulator of sigma E protease
MGSVLGFIVALVPLIALHEMGHMFVAKWIGVWVREFGIGLPPRIAKLFKWQETEFTLNALPLGGFARMEGEDILETPQASTEETAEMSEEEREAKKHSLYAQPPGKRMLIFAGGSMMNFITGWVLAILLFLTGVPVIDAMQVKITQVVPNSPAAAADLQAGDTIVSVNEQPIDDIELVTELTQDNLGEEITLTVTRDGEERTVSLTPRVDPPPNEGAMGVLLTGEPTEYHVEATPLPRALLNGTLSFFNIILQTLWAPIRILQGIIPLEAARPVGIVNISRIAYDSIQQSFTTGTLIPILNLLILVNVSLGVFNLLPIPALDGGRILLTAIEKIRNKPLSPRIQERVHQVALIIFMLLFVVITVLDLLYPVSLPTQLP